jgi:hypothetical protein
MPQARKGSTKKDADSGSATATKRRKASRKAEAEVDDDEDDDDEDEAPASNRRRITPEIAQQAAEMRENGATWQEVIDETGFNGAQLRPHIARLTEASIESLEDTAESVAEHREEGFAWYAMAVSLGKTIAEVKEMAEEGGADIEGRKYRAKDEDEDEDDEGDEDEDDEDEDEEPAPKRSAKSKSKSAGKTTAKKASGTRRKNPSKAA